MQGIATTILHLTNVWCAEHQDESFGWLVCGFGLG
jgi:hypothetical protein